MKVVETAGSDDIVSRRQGFLWCSPPCCMHVNHQSVDRLVGLVVKASALRAEDPGFESRFRRDFFGVESYQ